MCSLIVNPHLPFSQQVSEDQVKCLHHGLSQSNLLTESELQSCIFFLTTVLYLPLHIVCTYYKFNI